MARARKGVADAGIGVEELKSTADAIGDGASWLSSAIQTGYADGKTGKPRTDLVFSQIKDWRAHYDAAYALGEKAALEETARQREIQDRRQTETGRLI